ncbi:MAG: hypothetical protein C0600_03230 [Ignavibacteria bacterium]|nr:MAG: hypothetical protein C0600_03230 [Ignavibacteria bacterium]
MDRRGFFKLGFRQLKDQARKSAPEIVRKEITPTLIDVTLLTEHVDKAERLADELLAEHFGERFLRLKQSRFEGQHNGGIVLFEGSLYRDYHDGASLLYAALREMEDELRIHEVQNDPVLLRYVNLLPAFSRTADVYRKGKLVQAFPLYEDGEFDIEGEHGSMRVGVKDKRLMVVHSSCPNATCVAHPPIVTPGQRITCVPNDISIVIGM